MEQKKQAFFQAYRDRSGVIAGVPERIIDALLANFTFTGTPDEIERRCRNCWRSRRPASANCASGCTTIPADAIRLIGERVVPALTAAS